MGMSTHVTGIRPPDEKWHKMRNIYDACESGNVPIPEKVLEYFNYEQPDKEGVLIDIDNILEEWSDNSREGYQIQIDKIPNHVKILRFYNSW